MMIGLPENHQFLRLHAMMAMQVELTSALFRPPKRAEHFLDVPTLSRVITVG